MSGLDNEDKLNSHFPKFAIYMLFKESDTEKSDDLQSDMSSSHAVKKVKKTRGNKCFFSVI